MNAAAGLDVRLLAATFEKADDDAIEAWAADLPRERTAEALLLITQLRQALGMGEKMLRSRIEAEQILTTGEVWVAPDGTEYMWAGDRRREVADPEGLRAALIAMGLDGLAARALRDAFKTETKAYLTELDKIARFAPQAEDTVRDFVAWREGPKKLRLMEEK